MSAAETRASCLSSWPDAENGSYHPSCCRFPKSCSIPTDTTHLVPVNARPLPPGHARAPSAGQDTGQMRDEVARWFYRQSNPDRFWDAEWLDRSAFYASADELLDGPLRQLIAERDDLRRELDQARGQVQRVRELADQWDAESHQALQLADDARERADQTMHRVNVRHSLIVRQNASELRRVLDEPT